ncbi:uncharacterized protein LOC116930487 [Daphnia magna]|uniref:uncharacterized protein LOC116930487 n=1 Tax=Daphnia magna TaxID=35525 RepID=UPI001E1BACD2|nr:uncharacterized protein LOC116930487 [Daphnia magna]
MAAKWLNSVDVDFGVQFPRLSMRAVHGFVRSLKVEPQDLFGLVAAYTSSFLSQHSGIVRTELEGKEVNVVIRDSNIQEKFVRIAGIPQNLDLGVVKTRLKEFGTIIDARWERYQVAEDDVLYPVLATWMIVRMTLTKNIPSYITIGSYRAMVKYEGQKLTCRLCDDETHFSYNCPTLRRNKETINVQKPSSKMTKKTETVPEKPVPLPLDVDPMFSKAFLECGLQSSLLGRTPNLEISPTEQPVKSTDDSPRQTPPAQMIIPETQPDDSEPMTISMEPVEPNLGEVEPMETDKTNIVGLQEVAFHSCPIIESRYRLLANVGPNKNGTAILIRQGLDYSRLLLEPDGRLISIDLECFTFINIYAPSGSHVKTGRNNFLRQTVPAYTITTRLPFVLMGDFNCVDDIQDKASSDSFTSQSNIASYALKEMVTGLDLVDIWKKLNKSEPGHTFYHPYGSSRLDRIYASRSFAENFLNIYLQSLSVSDHQSVQSTFTCNLDLPHRTRSPAGLWKLNTSILSEKGYQNYVKNCIHESANHPLRESNVANWWESVLKPGIKRISVDYSKQRARMIRETKFFYQSCIQEMTEADTFDWGNSYVIAGPSGDQANSQVFRALWNF